MGNLANDTQGIFLVTEDQLKSFARTVVEEMQSEKEPDKMITAKEVMHRFNISMTTLWRMEKNNVLQPQRCGKMKRYRLGDVEKAFETAEDE